MSTRYAIPKELKLEAYERLKQEVVVDNLNLTIELSPGHNGVGAICRGFIDAISKHDAAVKNVEDQWISLKSIRRDFNLKNRVYRNVDGA